MADGWWDAQGHLPCGATVVPVTCASNKPHLTNFSGNQQVWPLYLMIGNNRNDIHCTPRNHTCILVGLIPCPPKGAKNTDNAWHSTVGTVRSPLWNLDTTGSGLKWNCADGCQRHCYAILAAWVRHFLERVMVGQVSYGSCLMSEIPKGSPMLHSTFRPLNNRRDQDVYSEHLDKTNIDVLQTLGVHRIHNQFWQYPL